MKIINKYKDIEMRPTRSEEEEVMQVLLGNGGFAVVELLSDKEGLYLRFIPTNPETMQPWSIKQPDNDWRIKGLENDLVPV